MNIIEKNYCIRKKLSEFAKYFVRLLIHGQRPLFPELKIELQKNQTIGMIRKCIDKHS
jgi:hypothetical protein